MLFQIVINVVKLFAFHIPNIEEPLQLVLQIFLLASVYFIQCVSAALGKVQIWGLPILLCAIDIYFLQALAILLFIIYWLLIQYFGYTFVLLMLRLALLEILCVCFLTVGLLNFLLFFGFGMRMIIFAVQFIPAPNAKFAVFRHKPCELRMIKFTIILIPACTSVPALFLHDTNY